MEELIFASRNASLSAQGLAELEAAARAAGVDWDDAALKTVDHTGC